jgi:hypothetical protein
MELVNAIEGVDFNGRLIAARADDAGKWRGLF